MAVTPTSLPSPAGASAESSSRRALHGQTTKGAPFDWLALAHGVYVRTEQIQHALRHVEHDRHTGR